MAEPITSLAQNDGQSIPSALAATPASKRARAKAAKPVKAEPPVDHPLAALVEAEAVIEAEAPAEVETAPELEPVAFEPVVSELVAFEPVAPESAAPEPIVSEPVPVESVALAPDFVSTPPAAVPAEPQKENGIMATTIENVTNTTAKAQAFFADANERAKGAVAKSTKLFEEATAFSKGNVEAIVESSKIAAKGFETLGQDAAEYSRKQFEEATAAFKTLASVKSPTEFLKLHSDFVRSSFDSMVAETSRSTESMLKLAGEVAQPISNRFAVAAEKMKTAA